MDTLSLPPSHKLLHPRAELVPTSPIASLSLFPIGTSSSPLFAFLSVLNLPHVLQDDTHTEGG